MIDPDVTDIDDAASSITTSLLVRAQQQDARAWEELVEIFGPTVYQWCRRLGLSSQDARDVSQEVFKSVLRALATFRREKDDDTFMGWLREITKNKVRDHWRRSNKQPHSTGGAEAQAVFDDLSIASIFDGDESETRSTIRRIMEFVKGTINETHWEIFWQLAVEERDPMEVAREFGMQRHNVYNIRSRVLKKLKREFGVDDPGAGRTVNADGN